MLSSFDFVTIILSLSLVIWAVLRAAGKKSSGSEYFLAGRDLRWQFIGMSLLASNISAEHVIGLAGDGYRVGLVVGGFEWVGASDLICLAAFFAPLYLREKSSRFRSSSSAASDGVCGPSSPRTCWS